MGKLVLVVEDTHENRRLICDLLEVSGYTTIEAKDGKEGVELAKARIPDLILMDLSLPVMNGWEATQRLKEDHRTRLIPIIALTAHAMDGDMQKAIESGCDDYDSKPIDLPQLMVKIETLLRKGRQHDSANS